MPTPFSYRAVLFDLDGTLYRGAEPIPGAIETVEELIDRGVLVRYVTNNATLTREAFAAKLRGMGFPALANEVYSSATGTATYLAESGIRSTFVVGMPGLVSTLRSADIEVVNAGEDGVVQPNGERAEAVVVGLCRTLSYELLDGAMNAIRSGGRFVATNPDATFPLEGGRFSPGAGSIVAAVRTCSGVEPFVVGKPKPFLIETILRDADLRPYEALVVGDRIDTDIAAGRDAGCPTYLVLSGVETVLPPDQKGAADVRGLLGL
ncbi:HAD-IIA family hydrolase [bacterium]|nr:MAG: HAD-IIA family hydrolase [bacterium]